MGTPGRPVLCRLMQKQLTDTIHGTLLIISLTGLFSFLAYLMIGLWWGVEAVRRTVRAGRSMLAS